MASNENDAFRCYETFAIRCLVRQVIQLTCALMRTCLPAQLRMIQAIASRLIALALAPWLLLALLIGLASTISPFTISPMPAWLNGLVMPATALLVWSGTILTPVAALLFLLLGLRLLVSRILISLKGRCLPMAAGCGSPQSHQFSPTAARTVENHLARNHIV